MKGKISRFLTEQKVASVCCIDEHQHPYCFNCYYAADTTEGLILFKSASSSCHMQYLAERPFVAGTVLPEKQIMMMSTGFQFKGELAKATHKHKKAYYEKFPAALAVPGEVHCIRLSWVKMTERTPLSSNKTVWQPQASSLQQ